jgi:ribose/xylose/arabinose/galactoside ABC-type transport system permease subunit
MTGRARGSAATIAPGLAGGRAGQTSAGSRLSWWWERVGPFLVLIVLWIYFTIESSAFFSIANVQEMGREAAELLLVALAGTMPILLGSIDLSVGSIVTLAGMTLAYYSAGQSWWLLVLLCAGLGLAAGLINGLVFVYGRVPSFLVTLGTSFLFPGVAQQVFGAVPITLSSQGLINGIQRNVLGVPVPCLIALAGLAVVTLITRNTVFGRNVYAVGGNERVARLSGISVRGTKIACFAIGGILCGLAALLLCVRISSATGDMGSDLLLPSIAAVVIGGTPLTGGVGGPVRTVLGVVLLEVLVDGMNIMSVSPFVEQIVEGLVVIAAVVAAVQRGDRGREAIVK